MQFWSALLTAIPALIAVALWRQVDVAVAITAGLAAFGVVFAMNSSIHSYMVLAYTDAESVSLNVGFYYMANAAGRLVGTLLSGGSVHARPNRSRGHAGLSMGFIPAGVVVVVQQPQAAGCAKRHLMNAWGHGLGPNSEFLLNIAALVGDSDTRKQRFSAEWMKSLLIPCVTSLAAPIVVW